MSKLTRIDDLILEINVPYPLDYRFRLRISGSYDEFQKPKPMRWVYGNIWNLSYHLEDIHSIQSPFSFQFHIEKGDSENVGNRTVNFSYSNEDIALMEVNLYFPFLQHFRISF